MSSQPKDIVPNEPSAEVTRRHPDTRLVTLSEGEVVELSPFEEWKASLPEAVQAQIERSYQWLWNYHYQTMRDKLFASRAFIELHEEERLNRALRDQIEVKSIAILRAMVWKSTTDPIKLKLGWPTKQREFEPTPVPLGLGRSRGFFSSMYARYEGLKAYLETAPLTGRDILITAQDHVFQEVNRIALDSTHDQQMAAIKEHNKLTGAYAPEKHELLPGAWRDYKPEND